MLPVTARKAIAVIRLLDAYTHVPDPIFLSLTFLSSITAPFGSEGAHLQKTLTVFSIILPLMDLSIERDSCCFCCGKDNERGLHLEFSYPGKGEAETSLRVPEYFQGWRKVTHGGFLSTILDEVMAHACIGLALTAVTAEITVRFKKPLKTGSRIKAVGKAVEIKGHVINTRGWIYDDEGNAVALADARFVVTENPTPG
jgi:uncharacterized protein (TIGR00369 family)